MDRIHYIPKTPRRKIDYFGYAGGEYSVYLRATEKLTFDRSTDIPVYLGYAYMYKGDYAYHTTFCRFENGWIWANGKAKYEGLRFVVDSELLKKEYK